MLLDDEMTTEAKQELITGIAIKMHEELSQKYTREEMSAALATFGIDSEVPETPLADPCKVCRKQECDFAIGACGHSVRCVFCMNAVKSQEPYVCEECGNKYPCGKNLFRRVIRAF